MARIPTSRGNSRSKNDPDEKSWIEKSEIHRDVSLSIPGASCMIGASIINNFGLHHPQLWNKNYPGWLNQGIGGDRTQHILWRVVHGCLPQNARQLVIAAGTNNTGHGSPTVISEAIIKIA